MYFSQYCCQLCIQNHWKALPPLSTLCFRFQSHVYIWLTQHLNMICAVKSALPPTLAWHNSACESIMRQRALHWCKNMRSCQWIHKSSRVHMDTLCDQMLQAFLILLTLYCSAHLLICLPHHEEHTLAKSFMLSEHWVFKGASECYLFREMGGVDCDLFLMRMLLCSYDCGKITNVRRTRFPHSH